MGLSDAAWSSGPSDEKEHKVQSGAAAEDLQAEMGVKVLEIAGNDVAYDDASVVPTETAESSDDKTRDHPDREVALSGTRKGCSNKHAQSAFTLSPIKDALEQRREGCDGRLVQAPSGDVSRF